jgi:hypothetical protein
MTHYFRRNTLLLLVVLVIALALAGQRPAATLGAPPGGGPISVTVTGNQAGITQQMVGAVEGDGGFDTADMLELGINNYRMYGGASRYEPVDDDGVYGSPSIAEIKADPNVINWSAWETQFNRSDGYFWSLYGWAVEVSSATMLAELREAGIDVVMTVRPRDNNNTPTWINPVPVYDTADRNEWWAHVFATVYYVNVLNDWQVDRWQVHNEPNQRGQGWFDNHGSMEDYAELVRLTADAVDYVYSRYLDNREHHIHAPVLSGNPNRTRWTPYLLDTVDGYFDVFDYHWYGGNQDSIAAMYHDYVAVHNPDGVLEPLFNSEWGTYKDSYDSVGNALSFSRQLYLMNLPSSYVTGSQVFSLYPWGATFDGLITTAGNKTETFWAFKTLIPAIQGGKASYEILGNSAGLPILASRDGDGTLYLAVVNTSSYAYSLTADVSAHLSSGTGPLTEYSTANKAVVVANPAVEDGQVSFAVPAQSVVRFEVAAGDRGHERYQWQHGRP